jgi:hypothetical protein
MQPLIPTILTDEILPKTNTRYASGGPENNQALSLLIPT